MNGKNDYKSVCFTRIFSSKFNAQHNKDLGKLCFLLRRTTLQHMYFTFRCGGYRRKYSNLHFYVVGFVENVEKSHFMVMFFQN
ncbi:unnamed protein product [Trifolium pratense]|uniref:Uncharacterized protein n=1 Tax=Trifolium pratense TaxID=57577 RepID=A0ACB0JPV6_TRIPR|nr:unnamed protein product [Trifolium pratense]